MPLSGWRLAAISIFVAILLAGACWLSAFVDLAVHFKSGHIRLSEGELQLWLGYEDPALSGFEVTALPGSQLNLHPKPVRWGQNQIYVYQGGTRLKVPGPKWIFIGLWLPFLLALFAAALLLGRPRRTWGVRRPTRLLRVALTSIAIVLSLGCATWNNSQPFTLRGYRYAWFHGGTLEVGEYPIPPRKSAVGHFDLLPGRIGPNALDQYAITVPLWLLALTTTAIAGWMHGRAWPIRVKGACGQCGYSTAGLVPSACPECGAAQPPKAR